ncbi:DNA gyrase inhibitor YacG [Nisaea acidiphila]|uniref:DNA gyrase inhibitor YacG n=1 Tax=Nisaea acidiphila TaxID=1862145 RepID=A0A9J7AX53_9PROT|nr:DNA gyrase inhibitor YacG [Nisaea acidiphila]UUX51370.1 DNA gyrase inhibitor YacG [Nisaea acidiphila]
MADISDFEKSKRKRKAGCAICGKPIDKAFRPFCSERCKTIDLGRWLGGEYRLQTNEEPDEAELLDLAQAMEERRER